MLFLYISVVLILAMIFYEDLKHRSVHLVFFLLLFILLLTDSIFRSSWETALINSVTNTIYLFIIFLISWVYLQIRKLDKSFTSLIGAGDIFLLLGLTVWFDFSNFVLFTLLSFSASLILHIVLSRTVFSYNHHPTVPLAGFVSAFLIPWFVVNTIHFSYGK